MTLGCGIWSLISTEHTREKVWPATVDPTEERVNIGPGRTKEINNRGYELITR